MKQTIIALLMTAFVSFSVHSGEDRSFDQYSREAINATKKILIDTGKCSDENDCTRKQYVFFNPISRGMELDFFTEESLVQKLFAMLAQQYYRLPEGSSLHARFISSTKEIDLKRSFFQSVPVFAEIHMQGKLNDRGHR